MLFLHLHKHEIKNIASENPKISKESLIPIDIEYYITYSMPVNNIIQYIILQNIKRNEGGWKQRLLMTEGRNALN